MEIQVKTCNFLQGENFLSFMRFPNPMKSVVRIYQFYFLFKYLKSRILLISACYSYAFLDHCATPVYLPKNSGRCAGKVRILDMLSTRICFVTHPEHQPARQKKSAAQLALIDENRERRSTRAQFPVKERRSTRAREIFLALSQRSREIFSSQN